MDEKLKYHIEEINRLAYQFDKQNYINMIVKKFKIDPEQARIDCKNWMDSYPLVLSDLGVLGACHIGRACEWITTKGVRNAI